MPLPSRFQKLRSLPSLSRHLSQPSWLPSAAACLASQPSLPYTSRTLLSPPPPSPSAAASGQTHLQTSPKIPLLQQPQALPLADVSVSHADVACADVAPARRCQYQPQAPGLLSDFSERHHGRCWEQVLGSRDCTASSAFTASLQRRHVRISGSEVRVGRIVERKGRMYEVVAVQHTQQGRGGAVIQAELRDVATGLKSNERFRTSESVEAVFVDERKLTFLYSDGSQIVLMDPESFEQVTVPSSMFGNMAPFLTDGMEVAVRYFNDTPLAASLPPRITCKVAQTEPFFKGQTAAPSYKKVVLENGVTIQAPSFILAGDEIVLQSSDLTYITRAKGEK